MEKALLREAWIDQVVAAEPTTFLSLTFLEPGIKTTGSSTRATVSEIQAVVTVNELFKRCNRSLFGRGMRDYLRGYGCVEYQASGQPHFHFLLTNEVSCDRLRNVVEKKLADAQESYRERGVRNPFWLMDAASVDVQPVTDVHGVARYVTKLYEKPASGERMLVLGEAGVML